MVRAVVLVVKAVWLVAVLLFAVVWLGHIRAWTLLFSLPPVTLVLSFFVFHRAPRPVRRVHHSVVALALLICGSLFVSWAFFPKEQSPVGAFLLVWGIGAGYLVFLLLMLGWLGILRLAQQGEQLR
jgi:hypothetical protein